MSLLQNMKSSGTQIATSNFMKCIGIVLTALGIFALVYQGVSYNKTEQYAQFGPVEIQATETKTIPIPPLVGGGIVLAGAILLAAGYRKKL